MAGLDEPRHLPVEEVSSRQTIWLPSTSASESRIILWNFSFQSKVPRPGADDGDDGSYLLVIQDALRCVCHVGGLPFSARIA